MAKKTKQKTSADPSSQQRYSNRFDTMFKALMRLSSVTIIRFINALFGTHWPDDSVVSYPSTEFHNLKGKKQGLVRRVADCAIRISTCGEDHDYIMEIQVKRDNGLVVRIFEYSLGSALLRRLTNPNLWRDEQWVEGLVRINTLVFPEPKILYLARPSPVMEVLRLDFGTQGVFDYRVEVVQLLEQSIADIEARHLTILLPFYVLVLRQEVERSAPGEPRMLLMKRLERLYYELTAAIERGTARGEMTQEDRATVMEHAEELLLTIYEPYEEFEEVKEMVEEVYLTRRQREVQQEREKGQREVQQEREQRQREVQQEREKWQREVQQEREKWQREVQQEREKGQERERQRQREVQQEREKWQELIRSLKESGVSKEQIEQALFKVYKHESGSMG